MEFIVLHHVFINNLQIDIGILIFKLQTSKVILRELKINSKLQFTLVTTNDKVLSSSRSQLSQISNNNSKKFRVKEMELITETCPELSALVFRTREFPSTNFCPKTRRLF